jgi:hypothetical protein
VYHHQDNVADFGPSGWNDAQKQRLERSESNVGKRLTGQWVPRNSWGKCEVVRKFREFNLEIESVFRRTDSGAGLAENKNRREGEMEAEGRM